MSLCKQTPQEFIKHAFTPQIAVTCTPLAEKHCQKNNLTFIELLQPFKKLKNDVHYRDPSGSVLTVRNLTLTFLDVNARPPQTTLARKFLNVSVSDSTESRPENRTIADKKVTISPAAPWFEAWRDTFLKVQYPSDHEYTKHFLSCILVVSSAEVNPVESIIQLAQSLNQMQTNAPGKLPKWFSSNILKYYVILHDNVEGNLESANQAYETLKVSYGEANSFLLKMNSRAPGDSSADHLPDPWSQFISGNIENRELQPTPESSPFPPRAVSNHDSFSGDFTLTYHPLSPTNEPSLQNATGDLPQPGVHLSKAHGLCLSTEDVERVKLLLFEFCKSCLLPYIEKQIQMLNDVISNKKGVSRSLFSATKRWFNPNKPGATSVPVNNLIYAPDSPELQVRRLGDLYFMFGHYSLAFQAYHLAKRDYHTDQAWLYYAGALEMAALAAFMANESSRKTFDYMDESILTYLNTCKMPQFAARATLLSFECLKNKDMYGEAASQLIRLTSEDSDLRSALFIEQACYCFLRTRMIRKYAFHMVLAGHRFYKAAQRKHSLRSYRQAYQVYEDSGWNLAEDHISYTIGRLAHNLQHFEEAIESFSCLVRGNSKQSVQQQGMFLREYLTILGNKLKKDDDGRMPVIVIPELNNQQLKLLMGPTPPLSTPGKIPASGVNFSDNETSESTARWHKLEEILVQEAQGSTPAMFKPIVVLYTYKDLNGKCEPIAIVNEPIQVCLCIVSSLEIGLYLQDVYLLWTFEDGVNSVSNENGDDNASAETYVKTYVTKTVVVPISGSLNVVLTVTPLATGQLTLKGICYTLQNSATDTLFIKGKQFFDMSLSGFKFNPKFSLSNIPLAINIIPLAPQMQVMFSDINVDFLCDEMQEVSATFRNSGTVPLHKVYVATSVPELLSDCDFSKKKGRPPVVQSGAPITPALRERLIRDNHITSIPLPNGKLDPGQSCTVTIFLRAPSKPGACLIDLLTYYESAVDMKIRYRLVRHKWNLSVHESVKLELSCQQSFTSTSDDEIVLVLRATNLNKVHSSFSTEIRPLSVGLLSKQWRFTKKAVKPQYVNLFSQESVHFVLKARRHEGEEKGKFSSITMNVDRDARHEMTPAYVAFAERSEQFHINMFDIPEYETPVKNKPEKQQEGLILLQWQAMINDTKSKRTVFGQTAINVEIPQFRDCSDEVDCIKEPSEMLQVIASSREKVTDEDLYVQPEDIPPVRLVYKLEYQSIVKHNFKLNKLCIVPVTLLMNSTEPSSLLQVCINTLGTPSLSSYNDMFNPYASKNFLYLGMSTDQKILEPLASMSVRLLVAITMPGTFHLGTKVQIFCCPHGTAEVPALQKSPIQAPMIVLHDDGSVAVVRRKRGTVAASFGMIGKFNVTSLYGFSFK